MPRGFLKMKPPNTKRLSGKIKPCPFCGGEAYLMKRTNGYYEIGCITGLCRAWICIDKKCKDCTDGYVRKRDVIKYWNRRVK